MIDLIKRIPSYVYWLIISAIYLMIFYDFSLLDCFYFLVGFLITVQPVLLFFILRVYYLLNNGEVTFQNFKEYFMSRIILFIRFFLEWIVLFVLWFFIPKHFRNVVGGLFVIETLLLVSMFLGYVFVVKLYNKIFRKK
jgi:hypothetical protein